MIVKLVDITKAVAKVKSLVAGAKQGIPGVLFDVHDDKLDVCYADGRQAVFETMDIELGEEEEAFGKIIIPYNFLVDVIGIAQPSGVIQVDSVQFSLFDTMLSVYVEKFIEVASEEEETERRVVGKLKQEIKVNRPDEDRRQSILTRINYSEMMFNSEVYDLWEKAKFVKVLNRLAKEDDKVLLISSSKRSASVANLNYSAYIGCEEVKNCGVCMTTKMAKVIMDILNKVDNNEIIVSTVDNKYCSISTQDEKVGIWFEMAKPNRMSLKIIEEATNRQYDSYRAVILRDAIDNVVKCCNSLSKAEFIKISFSGDEEDRVLEFGGLGNTSKDSDFSVRVEQSNDTLGDMNSVVLEISSTCLSDMLSLCTETYVVLDILASESNSYLRIADAKGRNEDGTIDVSAMYFTVFKQLGRK